jgi:mRNA interferase RelE/StbE
LAGTSYKILVPASIEKQLSKIPKRIAIRIREAIRSLATDPRPDGCKKLKGSKSDYRIREGDYRIIYEVRDDELVILLIMVANRREAYR